MDNTAAPILVTEPWAPHAFALWMNDHGYTVADDCTTVEAMLQSLVAQVRDQVRSQIVLVQPISEIESLP